MCRLPQGPSSWGPWAGLAGEEGPVGVFPAYLSAAMLEGRGVL